MTLNCPAASLRELPIARNSSLATGFSRGCWELTSHQLESSFIPFNPVPRALIYFLSILNPPTYHVTPSFLSGSHVPTLSCSPSAHQLLLQLLQFSHSREEHTIEP